MLDAAADTRDISSKLSATQRTALISACSKLHDALESPEEKVLRVMLSTHNPPTLRLAIDMDLPDIAAKHGDSITLSELAKKSGAEAAFPYNAYPNRTQILRRTRRRYVCNHTCWPPFTKSSPLAESITHFPTSSLNSIAKLPDFFAERGYRNPEDAFHGPGQYAWTDGELYFDWLARHEKYQHAFNVTMSVQRGSITEQWFDFFPDEKKLRVESPERALLVDVGGGLGHDLKRFHERFAGLQGRLFVEDLPAVVDKAADLAPIQTVGHDFFKSQLDAVRGAKAYYLRTVLHDWPDKQAHVILKNLKEVMADDSLLLINENVLSDKGVGLVQARLDIHMMSHCTALERTEKQWKELIEGAGFTVKQIWIGEIFSLIEAVPSS
ncbi:Nn.00g033820.m01.CDS01 [Neocucurbitaria sp. VM-36]